MMIEEKERGEMTTYLCNNCGKHSCRVDINPKPNKSPFLCSIGLNYKYIEQRPDPDSGKV